MQGDYSRFTFDEHKHYNGVLVQQGRVQLDADANEQGAIQAHRDRTEAIDAIGPCGAPKRDGGFRVVPLEAGMLDLGITAGRMYVDGLLCEVGGSPIPVTATPTSSQVELATLDADGRTLEAGQWVELSSRTQPAGFFKVTNVTGRRLTLGADPRSYTPADGAVARRAVTYTSQPDQPGAAALAPANGDRLLLYLDVWERHVTAVEDPAIREVALGGPDTTARVQTVCQVKFHPEKVGDALGCAESVPGWPPAASGGRLSATDTAPPPPADPCRLAPEGGFLGLENRLYRVEIHQPGDLHQANFKWSRDNGAVVFAVERGPRRRRAGPGPSARPRRRAHPARERLGGGARRRRGAVRAARHPSQGQPDQPARPVPDPDAGGAIARPKPPSPPAPLGHAGHGQQRARPRQANRGRG